MCARLKIWLRTHVVQLHAVEGEEASECADLVDEAGGEFILRSGRARERMRLELARVMFGEHKKTAYWFHCHFASAPPLAVGQRRVCADKDVVRFCQAHGLVHDREVPIKQKI